MDNLDCCNGDKKANIITSFFILLKSLFNLQGEVLSIFLIKYILAKDIYMIKILFIFFLISLILKGLTHYISLKTAHINAYNTLFNVRNKIIEHLSLLTLVFFKKHNTGEFTSIMEMSPEVLEFYLAHGKPEIIEVIIIPILIFVFMLFIDLRLSFLMLLGVPLMFLTQMFFKNTMNEGFKKYFEHETKMKSSLIEYIKNIRVIKSFAKDENISENILRICNNYCYYVRKSMLVAALPMALIDIFMEIGTVIVMTAGAMFFYNKEITFLNLILAITLSLIFSQSISKTATLHHYFIMFQEAKKEISKILLEKVAEHKTECLSNAGNIEFKNVSFKYNEDGNEILKNINFKIEKNSHVALIGASGCGKTTCAHLLMGYWDVTKGCITIDDKDIKNVSSLFLSKLIGNVGQEVILFNKSIFENVALGKKDASLEEVIKACKKARIHEFISSLPKKYNTNIGEMGLRLSGGERQRISIARSILKNPPILILDEATASIDRENEKAILEVLKEISEGKTVITIAHRLKTIKDADKIIFIDKGQIIKEGTHKELLELSEEYRKMIEIENNVETWELKGMEYV